MHASRGEPLRKEAQHQLPLILHNPVFGHLMVPDLYLSGTQLPISHFVDAVVEAE